MTSIRPRIRPRYRCESVAGFGLVLESDAEQFVARGEFYERLGPLLDGRSSIEDILTAVADLGDPMAVFKALDDLRSRNILVDGGLAPLDPAQEVFWDKLDIDPATASNRLAAARLSIEVLGGGSATFGASLTGLLSQNGIEVLEDGRDCVVVVDDLRCDALSQFHAQAVREQRTWLLLALSGQTLLIGPAFHPNRPGCWECLRRRIDAHGKLDGILEPKADRRALQTGRGALPSSNAVIAGVAATAITRWVAGDRRVSLQGEIHAVDTTHFDKRIHVLVPHPSCGSCAALSAGQPPKWVPADDAGRVDDSYRLTAPEDTAARLMHHVSPLTGIVASLERIPPPPASPAIHCYVADHVFTPMNGSLARLREGREGRSSGKGRTEAQAKASALAEAIERYSGVCQGTETIIRARLADLNGAGLDPNACMLFSEAQISGRGRAHPLGGGPAWLPKPFDPFAETAWAPVRSLDAGATRYLPAAYCYYGYGQQAGEQFARADSNGCAAGNTLEEAILQGFMELVERDAVALWWYNRIRRPAVDLDALNDPYIDEVRECYRIAGRDIWVLDLTTDLGIPAFAAISRRSNQQPERLLFGFGAHLNARLAVSRAVTEVNQALLLLQNPPESREAAAGIAPGPSFDWWFDARLQQHPHLIPSASGGVRLAPAIGVVETDLERSIQTCIEAASGAGLGVLVLDQTRPDTGLAVAKVIVPGLRHFWPRFAPGRLYDIPVRMGWLTEATKEDALNPAHFFL